jgi:ribosomal protein S6
MKDAVVEPEIADIEAEVGMDEGRGAEPTVYEIGYHILPTLLEEAVQKEVEVITEVLKGVSADFIAEKLPIKMDLAYTMEKKIDGVNRRFSSAYFGWVAFAVPAMTIAVVKDAMDKDAHILRYLIVKTSREAVAANMADPEVDISTKVLREVEVGGEVSEAALDTALKQIETEDVKVEEKS